MTQCLIEVVVEKEVPEFWKQNTRVSKKAVLQTEENTVQLATVASMRIVERIADELVSSSSPTTSMAETGTIAVTHAVSLVVENHRGKAAQRPSYRHKIMLKIACKPSSRCFYLTADSVIIILMN